MNNVQLQRVLSEWDLPPNVEDSVCKKLPEITCKADLAYLNPEVDLADVVLPTQARKVAPKIKAMFSGMFMKS